MGGYIGEALSPSVSDLAVFAVERHRLRRNDVRMQQRLSVVTSLSSAIAIAAGMPTAIRDWSPLR